MNVLFVGAGKNLGQALIQHHIDQQHQVFHITGTATQSQCHELVVDWHSVKESDLHRWLCSLPSLDLIFFNQNSSSLSDSSFAPGQYSVLELWKQTAHWRQSHYVSCQLPFQIIHTLSTQLHRQTRVCWMLSSMVVQHKHRPGHADYIANKFQNYLMIENFSKQHHACFLGFEPGAAVRQQDHTQSVQLINRVLSLPVADTNGRVYDMNGNQSSLFAVFL
jgi:hypothetical protein